MAAAHVPVRFGMTTADCFYGAFTTLFIADVYVVLLPTHESSRLSEFDAFDNHRLHGDVLHTILYTGVDFADRINNFHAFDDFAKHGIANTVLGFVTVEEVVIVGVDKKLTRRAVGNAGPRHRERVLVIPQPVAAFVLDWRVGIFAAHVFGEPAALDHEPIDDAMENGARIKSGLGVFEKVLR